MKICKKCNIEKDINEFRFKKEKNGKYYPNYICKECERAYDRERNKNNKNKKEYAKQYYLKNKERLEEYKRQWRYKNREKINKKRRENYAKKKQKI